MNVRKLCNRGQYDKITLNITTEPLYGSDIELYDEMSFEDSLCTGNNVADTGMFKVRINILGVYFTKDRPVSRDAMRDLDKNRKAVLYKVGANKERSYLLAYADLIIVRDGSTLSYNANDVVNSSEDRRALIHTASNLKNHGNNVVIVDKVYVYDKYRQCGISSWIHQNIRGIMYQYIGVDVSDIILIPGDFSAEAGTKFGMTDEQYLDMLRNHYLSVGYEQMKSGLMIRRADKEILKSRSFSENDMPARKTLLGAFKEIINGKHGKK